MTGIGVLGGDPENQGFKLGFRNINVHAAFVPAKSMRIGTRRGL
jgi:hypothetical protein